MAQGSVDLGREISAFRGKYRYYEAEHGDVVRRCPAAARPTPGPRHRSTRHRSTRHRGRHRGGHRGELCGAERGRRAVTSSSRTACTFVACTSVACTSVACTSVA
eukprot:501653-Prymnesium_polylepis.2